MQMRKRRFIQDAYVKYEVNKLTLKHTIWYGRRRLDTIIIGELMEIYHA